MLAGSPGYTRGLQEVCQGWVGQETGNRFQDTAGETPCTGLYVAQR